MEQEYVLTDHNRNSPPMARTVKFDTNFSILVRKTTLYSSHYSKPGLHSQTTNIWIKVLKLGHFKCCCSRRSNRLRYLGGCIHHSDCCDPGIGICSRGSASSFAHCNPSAHYYYSMYNPCCGIAYIHSYHCSLDTNGVGPDPPWPSKSCGCWGLGRLGH